jgi:hypothetical protein
MKDTGTAIRKSYYDALNGNLTFNATDIPVVDGKVESIPADGVFVLFGDQSDSDRTNKKAFVHEVTLDVAIVDKRLSTGSKKDVEEISDQILGIIKPTAQTHGVTIAAPFKITWIKYESGTAAAVAMDGSNQFIQVKRLQFTNRITQ